MLKCCLGHSSRRPYTLVAHSTPPELEVMIIWRSGAVLVWILLWLTIESESDFKWNLMEFLNKKWGFRRSEIVVWCPYYQNWWGMRSGLADKVWMSYEHFGPSFTSRKFENLRFLSENACVFKRFWCSFDMIFEGKFEHFRSKKHRMKSIISESVGNVFGTSWQSMVVIRSFWMQFQA